VTSAPSRTGARKARPRSRARSRRPPIRHSPRRTRPPPTRAGVRHPVSPLLDAAAGAEPLQDLPRLLRRDLVLVLQPRGAARPALSRATRARRRRVRAPSTARCHRRSPVHRARDGGRRRATRRSPPGICVRSRPASVSARRPPWPRRGWCAEHVHDPAAASRNPCSRTRIPASRARLPGWQEIYTTVRRHSPQTGSTSRAPGAADRAARARSHALPRVRPRTGP